jgi:glyoxylase-like metal-dependent hydrolase (beta-lactamase superfamily II)
MEIMPGIYQLQLPLPDNTSWHVNVYLIQGDRGWLLVDTGWDSPEAFAALERQLGELGLSFEDIAQIVITHVHPDHYGLAGKLKQLSKAELALHYREKGLIEIWHIKASQFIQEMSCSLHSNGMPEEGLPKYQAIPGFGTPTFPEVTLSDGDVISSGSFHFEVLWTPGHSPGHICLYERGRRILISGDHILPITTSHIGLYPLWGDSPLDDYLRSLAGMKGLDVDLILPGHEHVFQGLRQRIEELLQHHQERKEAILERIKESPKSAYRIAGEIPWVPEIGGVPFQDLTKDDRRLAMMETLSHLESLWGEGKVGKITTEGIILYCHG